MKTLNTKLADYLDVDGWDIERRLTNDLDWWADEIWELRSRWAPVGAPAYITFLVDPMWEGTRRKGQGVWAVGCNAEFPSDKDEATRGGTLTLRAPKAEIEKFVEVVAGLRECQRHA